MGRDVSHRLTRRSIKREAREGKSTQYFVKGWDFGQDQVRVRVRVFVYSEIDITHDREARAHMAPCIRGSR